MVLTQKVKYHNPFHSLSHKILLFCSIFSGDKLVREHRFLCILSMIAASEFIFHYLSVQYTNNHCVDSKSMQFVVILLKVSKDIGFMVMSILLCKGWGITFAVVTTGWTYQMIKLIAGVMLIPSLLTAYAIVTVVDILEPFSFFIKLGILMRISSQIKMTLYMMHLLKTLKKEIKSNDAKKYEQLKMFERLQIVIQCVVFIYTIHNLWSDEDNIAQNWRYNYIELYGIWDVLFCILLITMLCIWRPSSNYNAAKHHVLNISEFEPLNQENTDTETMDCYQIDSDIQLEELLNNATEYEVEAVDINDIPQLNESLSYSDF